MSKDVQKRIEARPLNVREFQEFGEVVAYAAETGRHMIDAVFDIDRDVAEPRFWVLALPPTPQSEILIDALEQHPHSAQTFIPLGSATCMCVVCSTAENGGPDLDRLHAFVVSPGQGICYNRGTWHSGLMSIGASCEVAVVMGLTGGDDDTRVLETHAEIIMQDELEGAAC